MSTCFQIHAFDAQAYGDALPHIEARFTALWAMLSVPARMLARTAPLSLAPRREELRTQLLPLEDVRAMEPFLQAARETPTPATWQSLHTFVRRRADRLATVLAPNVLRRLLDGETTPAVLDTLDAQSRRAVWPWRWLKEEEVEIDRLERQRPPLTIEHYLVTWEGKEVSPDVIADHLVRGTRVPHVDLGPLPALWHGSYREQATYLEPLEPGDPYMTVLTAWDVRGTWDLLTWHDLLMSDIELVLAVDVLSQRGNTERQLENARRSLRAAQHGVAEDTRSDRAQKSVSRALQVIDTQSIHELHYALLVKERTLNQLEERVAKVERRLGRQLAFERVVGAQAAYLHLFSDRPAHRITAPMIRRNTTSQGVANKMTCGIRRHGAVRGVPYGIDTHTGLTVYHTLFGADGKRNESALYLGMPGKGKTVSIFAQALRHAAAGCQVIIAEPTGQCWRMREMIGNDVAVDYHDLSRTPALNPFDPISMEPAKQAGQLLRKLRVMLGDVEDDGGRVTVKPFPITPDQSGTIDEALQHPRLYGPDCYKLAELTPATAPRFEDLVAVLGEMGRAGDAEANYLARIITKNLLGTKASIYNRPTELVLDTSADVILLQFDNELGDNTTRPLVYDYLFEVINKYVTSPQRDKWARPLLFYLDEFYYMAVVRSLEQYAARSIKTWRNHRAAFRPIDQSVEAFFGTGGKAEHAGALIVGSVAHRFFYTLSGDAVHIIANVYRDMLSHDHIQQIQYLDIGHCVAMLDTGIHTLDVRLTPQEYHYLVERQAPQQHRRTA
jgi:hypothetical protein